MTTLHALITRKGNVSLTFTNASRQKLNVRLTPGDGVVCGREPDVARAREEHGLPAMKWQTLGLDGDREVSRNHIALWLDGGRLHAKDLSSLGTTLDLPREEDEETTIRIPIEIPIEASGDEVSFDLHVGSGVRAMAVSAQGDTETLKPIAWRDLEDFNDQIRIELQGWLDRRRQGGTVEAVPDAASTRSSAKSSIAEGRRMFSLLGDHRYLLVRFGAVPMKELPELFHAVDEWLDEQKERYAREATCQCQGKMALLSDKMRQSHEKLVRAAQKGCPRVLVRGPTGVGKTVCAQCFRHNHRDEFRRAPDRFQAVNCAAIAPNLLESELFGHVRGAFTGAVADRKGLIRSADRGIVFLDEIGELNLAAQAALLKVIEERKVRPVGSDREYDVDVVFIMASNLDFEKAIREGRFREDLYFRIAQVSVTIPPLTERMEDVAGIVSLEEGGPQLLSRLDDDARGYLLGEGGGPSYPWSGNAREVKDFVAAMSDHIAREGRITLTQCRAALNPFGDAAPASAASGVTTTHGPVTSTTAIHWPTLFERASARALQDDGNKVDKFALWSKALLVAQLVAKRKGATAVSEMPDPKTCRDDKETRALFVKLAGELEVGQWTTVADHYEAFFALLAGAPHPRRTRSAS